MGTKKLQNLVGTIEKHWSLTSVVLGPVLQEFADRAIGALSSAQGKYIYKYWDRRIDTAEQATSIFDFLKERGFAHAPELLHTRDGTNTLISDDGTLLLLVYVEGDRPAPKPDNYGQLGQILGELNSIDDYPYDSPMTLAGLRPDLAKVAGRLGGRDATRFLELASRLPDLDQLPKSLIHFEMALANSVLQPDGTIVAVDWDEAGMGPRVFDLGHFVIDEFISEELVHDDQSANAFFTSYRAKVQLTTEEIAAIFDAALFRSLRRVSWGDALPRWRRIEWALDHRKELLQLVTG